MRVFQLVVKGRIPSKKNNRRNYGRTSLPSVKFLEWENQACIQLLKHKNIAITEIQEIQMDFYFPDNKKADLDNKSSSVLDMLQKIGIIKGDHWQETGRIYLNPMGIDRSDPRVEIFIKSGAE